MRAILEQLQPTVLLSVDRLLAEDKLSHAYLLSGDFGGLELALYLAQSRFCEERTAVNQPCGNCRSCRLIALGEFTDVTMIEPEGQLIKTEQVRQLTKAFSRTGYEGVCQVFIIRGADKMHPNAANSLLKQIEEPNSAYYVFLLTSDESKVLPTIKSRCQTLRLVTDRSYLEKAFEVAGLLKSQAIILAQLVQEPSRVQEMAGQTRLLELIRLCQGFVEQLTLSSESAYLQVGRLVTQASDKEMQDWCLQILAIQAAQLREQSLSSAIFQKIHEAKQMWLANVSLQNVLDYLVLSLEEGR